MLKYFGNKDLQIAGFGLLSVQTGEGRIDHDKFKFKNRLEIDQTRKIFLFTILAMNISLIKYNIMHSMNN